MENVFYFTSRFWISFQFQVPLIVKLRWGLMIKSFETNITLSHFYQTLCVGIAETEKYLGVHCTDKPDVGRNKTCSVVMWGNIVRNWNVLLMVLCVRRAQGLMLDVQRAFHGFIWNVNLKETGIWFNLNSSCEITINCTIKVETKNVQSPIVLFLHLLRHWTKNKKIRSCFKSAWKQITVVIKEHWIKSLLNCLPTDNVFKRRVDTFLLFFVCREFANIKYFLKMGSNYRFPY